MELLQELGSAASAKGHPTSTYYLVDALEQVRTDRVLEMLPRRLSSLYNEAAWLPNAASLQYDPGTPAARTGGGNEIAPELPTRALPPIGASS